MDDVVGDVREVVEEIPDCAGGLLAGLEKNRQCDAGVVEGDLVRVLAIRVFTVRA